jgi:cobalt-zinc-cadmium efflux system protein
MSRTARLGGSLLVNLALSVGLVIASRAAHSTGLAADAGHNLTDAMAILVALVAIYLARRPATERRSYGYSRVTILAALINGVVLVAVTVTIAVLAIERLIHPRPIHGGIVLIAASVSAMANAIVVLLLSEDHHDLNVRSAAVHALGDTLSAAVVAIAGLIALVASGPVALRVDPIASLIVAAFIVVEGFRVTAASLHVLLEGVPADIDLAEVRRALCDLEGIVEVHDLHAWSLDSEHRALSAHLVVEGDPSLAATTPLLAEVRTLLARRFRIEHATVELETSGCCGDELHHP